MYFVSAVFTPFSYIYPVIPLVEMYFIEKLYCHNWHSQAQWHTLAILSMNFPNSTHVKLLMLFRKTRKCRKTRKLLFCTVTQKIYKNIIKSFYLSYLYLDRKHKFVAFMTVFWINSIKISFNFNLNPLFL